jgi:hypothetical protein
MMRYLLTTAAAVLALAFAPQGLAATPPASFAATPPPPAPDYALARSWASRPAPDPSDPRAVDVFYVHPTTFHGAAWNQDVADTAVNEAMDASVLRTQASAFAACCRIFAPRYRQASSAAFYAKSGDGERAYDLAYTDVLRAFQTYLREDNHGRPFILAGHSQGALQVLRLLEERLDGRPERKQLVAAYVVGIGVSRGVFGKLLKTIPACDHPLQTGCVITWNTYAAGQDPTAFIAASQTPYTRQFGDDPGKALVCINPLTFDTAAPAAGPDRHLGAVLLKPGSRFPAPVDHAISAECRDGVLSVSAPTGAVALSPLPGGSLHMQDVELFWGNIQADALARGQAFFRKTPTSEN